MDWFYLGSTLSLSATAGFLALRRRRPALVWVSGLLLNVAGTQAWWPSPPGGFESVLSVHAACLAASSVIWTLLDALSLRGVPHCWRARRPVVYAHAAVQVGIVLMGLVAMRGVVRGLLDWEPLRLHAEHWLAWIATGIALAACLWDRTASFSLAGLYLWGLIAVGFGQVQRGFAPAQFFLWGSVCDLAGFVLVAALLGWVLTMIGPGARKFAERRRQVAPSHPGEPLLRQGVARLPGVRHFLSLALRIPGDTHRWSGQWFRRMQALLALADAALAAWIAADVSFDGIGAGVALFGLSGRLVACPAALMLLGAAILMAWQNRGHWRAGWQYAALGMGMLFTTTIGWSTMDAASACPGLHRSINLLISASMMTLMTGFGLGRVLPRRSDWIARGHQAMPAFGLLALLLAAMLAVRRLW